METRSGTTIQQLFSVNEQCKNKVTDNINLVNSLYVTMRMNQERNVHRTWAYCTATGAGGSNGSGVDECPGILRASSAAPCVSNGDCACEGGGESNEGGGLGYDSTMGEEMLMRGLTGGVA